MVAAYSNDLLGNEALFCNLKTGAMTLWRMKEKLKCQEVLLGPRDQVEEVSLTIYQPNIIQYEIETNVCLIVDSEIKVYT